MPIVETATIRTHAQILGPALAVSGRPAIVMLHGFLVGSLAEWYFTAGAALARHRTVVAYDLRGHGRSERALSGYDLPTLAGDLGALLAALQVPAPVDLVGHSGGGLVALTFALHHPELVRRLALVDVPLPPTLMEEMTALDARGLERLVEGLPGPLRAALGGGGRRARRLLEALGFLVGESTLLADLAREPDIPDARLAGLTPDLLAIFGASSRCLPAGERLARVVPGARLSVLPGGHFLPVESPAALTAELEAFLLA